MTVLTFLFVIGGLLVALWAVNAYLVPPPLKMVVNLVLVLILVAFVLSATGLVGNIGTLRIR